MLNIQNLVKKKRKCLIYFVIFLIVEDINLNKNIFNVQSSNIEKFTSKIDLIYKEIKKNEISPKTDYLFHNLEKKTNAEKSFEKLEMLNKLGNL